MSSTVVDAFIKVVESMRSTVKFTVSSENNGVYTINADHDLNDYDYIKIGESEYQVTNTAPGSFTFSSSAPIFDGEFINLKPYSMYGHKLEIANRLRDKDQDSVYKYQKYPLIALSMPFSEDVQKDTVHGLKLNIAIVDNTSVRYLSEERYENVIKPILEPLYNDFLEAVTRSGLFLFQGIVPEHTRIDRLFYGTDGEQPTNSEYIFDDALDAIEIINLKVKLLKNNC